MVTIIAIPLRVYLKTGNMTNGEDFPPDEAIFLQEYFWVLQKNGAQQVEKTRCLGVLTVFR